MARNNTDAWNREEQGSEVVKRLAQVSVAETRLKSEPMSGSTKSIPRMGSMGVDVIPKGGAYGEDESANDEVILKARKLGKALRIAEEDIDDNVADVITNKKVDWATSFGTALDNAVFAVNAAENGTTVPFTSIYRALTTADSAVGYTANAHVTTSTELDYDDLSDLMAMVEGTAYSGTNGLFVAHPTIRGAIRKIKDANGTPIFTPSARQDDPDTLFGSPIAWSHGAVVSTTISAAPGLTPGGAGAKGTAGNPLIFFGNPDYAVVGKRSGPESFVIPANTGLAALTDEAILKVRARRAFVLTHPLAWAVLELVKAA